jgi:hypothetical protein
MKLIKHPLAGLFGLTLALSACGTTAPAPTTLARTQALSALELDPRLDGQAIFRGIAFGEQQLGELLPEVWQGISVHDLAADETDLDGLLNEVDAFVEEVDRFAPGYFANLSAAMRSGNPLQVEDMLQNTGTILEGMFPEETRDDVLTAGDAMGGRIIFKNRFIYRDRHLVKNRLVGVDSVLVKNTVAVRDTVAIKDKVTVRESFVAKNSIVARETILARLKFFTFRAEELDTLFTHEESPSLQRESVISNLTARLAR